MRPPQTAGFVLPLACTGALLLLLSSLSLQGVVLHGRAVQAAERSRLQADDQLASAAQLLAADLQGPYACLQPLPSSRWQERPLPDDCPPDLDPAGLQQLAVAGQPVLLSSWQPAAEGGELRLQLPESGLQRRFQLDGRGVRELGS